MRPPRETPDLLRMFGMAPKTPPVSAHGYDYANFQRRMFAACIDTFLLALLVLPVSQIIVNLVHGHMPMDWAGIEEAVRAQTTEEEARRVFQEKLMEMGYYARWATGTLLQLMAFTVYTLFCWQRYGGTLGKLVMRLRIIDADTGLHPRLSQFVLRYVGYVASALPLLAGFFWIGLDKRKQGWHDKLARTEVVVWKKKEEIPAMPATCEPTEPPADHL